MLLTEQEAREKWPVVAGPRYGHSKGYVRVRVPSHPNADAEGWVYEHIYAASLALGRGLKKGETAHHVYGDTADNRNLVVCTHSYHRELHERLARSPDWPQFATKKRDRRPRCARCEKPIPYDTKTGLCRRHFEESAYARD